MTSSKKSATASSAKNIASKPTAAQREKALAGKQKEIHVVGYSEINDLAVPGRKDALKSAYTTAVFQLGAFCKVSAKGTVTSTKKPGDWNLVKAAAPALKHWKAVTPAHGVLIDADNVMLPAGQVFLHNRLSDSGPAFNTDKDLIAPFLKMLTDGTPVEIEGYTVKPIKPRAKNYKPQR